MPCDPITLEYHNTISGQSLKYADDLVKYRASARTENLRSKMVSAYNPVTGEPMPLFTRPEMPVIPPSIADFKKTIH